MCDITGIEAVDIYRALSDLAGRDSAAEGIAAGGGYTGHVPHDGVMVSFDNTHRSVRGSRAGCADVQRRIALSGYIICFTVDIDRL